MPYFVYIFASHCKTCSTEVKRVYQQV